MRGDRKHLIIALDGPAGVGKSTVGFLVARTLGYQFLNTGEMYRALTWKVLSKKIQPTEEEAVVRLAHSIRWEFRPVNGRMRIVVDGDLIGSQIRMEKVSKNSSVVASILGVRLLMRNMQRHIGREGGLVLEGRDITTNVFPNADFKFYLDASIEERALRRFRQLRAAGEEADLLRIREDILERDLRDFERKINPLRKAPDAIVIDATHLTRKQVAAKILGHIRARS
ncbi:MAG: cytidylate kinase [Elusimicrobia bacterium RIFCSPLOWO2_12_FULL_59_9]|nr:MAG: cytidylate kinase [Elusimicrobia bacterium RIFCSPLOWO2_12_FULL_59_9]